MKFVLLGCYHGIQPPEGVSDLPGLPMVCQYCSSPGVELPHGVSTCQHIQEQRSHFRSLVAEVINRDKIQSIAEEWGRSDKTISCELIGEDKWTNINTSCADLKRLKIPCDYLKRENGKCRYGDTEREAWQKQREEFMVGRIKENRGQTQNVLVICGFVHMEPIAEALSATPIDYRKNAWYRPDVFSDDP